MSSILDALRKIEAAEPPGIHKLPEPHDPTVTTRRTVVALVVAFVAGAGLAIWFGRGPTAAPEVALPEPANPPTVAKREAAPQHVVKRAAPKVPTAPPPSPPAPALAATPPPVMAPTPAPVAAPPPVAIAASPAPAPPAPTAPSAPVAAPVEPPAALPIVPPAARPALAAELPRGRIAAASPPPASPAPAPARAATPAPTQVARESILGTEPLPRPRMPARPVVTPPPAGAPHVTVSFLLYSIVPSRRSVTLNIDGLGLVSLKEGDTESGIEVARILPDRVELRYGGQSYAVLSRD